MIESQTRASVIQWVAPSAAFVVILLIMLFNFSTKSKVNANDAVIKNLASVASEGADRLTYELSVLDQVGRPIADLLGEIDIEDQENMIKLAKVTVKNTGAYLVSICDAGGNGVDSNGNTVSLAGESFFAQIGNTSETEYIYSQGVSEVGDSAIIVSIPIHFETGIGHLLLFYSFGKFDEMVKGYDLVPWTMEMLIDRDGNIMAVSGNSNPWSEGLNIFDELVKIDTDNGRRFRTRADSRINGMLSFEINGKGTALVSVPVSAHDWTLIAGVDQDYVDRQIAYQWNSIKNMMYQLTAAIVVFIAVVVIINIITKLRNNEKKRQLEEKADTDLLTGLNNKLATERKIKEFIAGNPKAQSMMFILDIDNFKKINDTMGHAFGDEVLRSLGQQIGGIFRATDIVGRAGGDEFIIFLKNINSYDVIQKEASKVEQFFRDFKAGEYVKYSATASIGVAIYPQEGADFESIYKAADQALYKAKKRGKNQLAFYKDAWKDGDISQAAE